MAGCRQGTGTGCLSAWRPAHHMAGPQTAPPTAPPNGPKPAGISEGNFHIVDACVMALCLGLRRRSAAVDRVSSCRLHGPAHPSMAAALIAIMSWICCYNCLLMMCAVDSKWQQQGCNCLCAPTAIGGLVGRPPLLLQNEPLVGSCCASIGPCSVPVVSCNAVLRC